MVTELRNRHNQGEFAGGINVRNGTISDMWAEKIVQPLLVNTSEIQLATECVGMILKIGRYFAPPTVNDENLHLVHFKLLLLVSCFGISVIVIVAILFYLLSFFIFFVLFCRRLGACPINVGHRKMIVWC